MKIVSFKTCPFVQRVTALLEAKHVPYDIEYIDLSNTHNSYRCFRFVTLVSYSSA